MRQYFDLLREVLGYGEIQKDPRTGVVRLGITGYQQRFYLNEGFPILTTKFVGFNWLADELFWKLQGKRDAHSLYIGRGPDIWNRNAFQKYLENSKNPLGSMKNTLEWEKAFGEYQSRMKDPSFDPIDSDLGPVYGAQLRNWRTIKGKNVDQLKNLIDNLRSPEKRNETYNFMTSLNIGEIDDMALAPCPFFHFFSVYGDNLDSTCSQRSCDLFLGIPFNIGQESLLLFLLAKEAGLNPRKFTHQYHNLHAYVGAPPRSDFLTDPKSLSEFQRKFISISSQEDYPELKRWYLTSAPQESQGNERKDHIPFMLEQLSKPIRNLPRLIIKQNLGLLEIIEKRAREVVYLEGYDPHKWDSKAVMAA